MNRKVHVIGDDDPPVPPARWERLALPVLLLLCAGLWGGMIYVGYWHGQASGRQAACEAGR